MKYEERKIVTKEFIVSVGGSTGNRFLVQDCGVGFIILSKNSVINRHLRLHGGDKVDITFKIKKRVKP